MVFITSCAPQRNCSPSKRSRDYAVARQLKSGIWEVTREKGCSVTKLYYECLPDSLPCNTKFIPQTQR